MHFWLLVEGEPLPTDYDKSRLHRMCSIAEIIHSRGHQVSLWSSTTNHRDKIVRSNKQLVTNYLPGYDVILLDSPTYTRNVSLARIIHNIKTAEQFKKIVAEGIIDAPDLIITAYPAIELAKAGIEVARDLEVPSIVDVRDLWPDIFVEILPRWIQFIAKLAVRPFEKKARFIADNASSVIGITDEFTDWFEQKATNKFLNEKRSFPLSYKIEEINNNDKSDALKFWRDKGITQDKDFFTICLFGNLVDNAEIPLLVEAAKKIEADNIHNVRFVVCGVGDLLESLLHSSRDLQNFYLPGWVTKKQIRVLMQMSNAGVLPYRSDRGFELSFPNKVGEYLSEGLPIISSINGVLSKFLESEDVGLTYKNNDVEGLVNSIYTIRDNKNLESNMREKAKRVFNKKFNDETVYQDLADYLENKTLSRYP